MKYIVRCHTQGCAFESIVNLAKNITDAATKEGKNLMHS